MRICYFSGDCQGIYDHRILKKILEAGHEVYYLFFRTEEIYRDIASLPGIKIIRFFPQVGQTGGSVGIKKSIISHLKTVPFVKEIVSVFSIIKSDSPYYFGYVNRFKTIINEIKPDIVQACYIQNCGLITALANFHPYLLMVWGSDILINPHESLYEKLKTKYAVNRADFIACDSQYHKDATVKVTGYPADRIVSFPWGIDQKMFNPSKRDDTILKKLGWEGKKIIIMNRWFEEVYGVEYFIQALPEVIKQITDARVILIGEGGLEKKIRQMVSDLGLDKVIWFAGRIPHEKMADYLGVSDLYVSSSLSDGSSSCLMEALSCALPAVVSDVPVYYEWVKDDYNGYIVPRKDPSAISRSIVRILKDPDLMIKMKKNSLMVAKEKADWDKNYQKMEEVYKLLACG